ncbi:hypothetical protein CEV31_2201 [Brucella thiophenivorans]|uniref:Uncharacterized protein n=1 Tax=Brucella thiophenivorans TaxID=571255 RepID=A0A256FWQ1_9HYPH|nr:hypothetical protein CEV31_2201 [Brucella thiophenivorans]
METKTRDFSPRGFGSLKERIVIGYFDLCAVYLNICHRLSKPAALAASSRCQTHLQPMGGGLHYTMPKPYSAASRRVLRL